MYEIFEKLCKLKGITAYKFGKDMKVNSSTLSTWKKKNSLARPDLAEKVCEYFDVSIDFLMGKKEEIECKECGQTYNPFDVFDCDIHTTFHKKIIEARKIYPMLIPYKEIHDIIAKAKIGFSNDKEKIFEEIDLYLKAEFSQYVYVNYDLGKEFNYSDYCKMKVVDLLQEEKIPDELTDIVISVYDIDKSYLDDTRSILIKANQNAQMIRLLKYVEKLNQKQLDMIEIQLKALAEQNKKE